MNGEPISLGESLDLVVRSLRPPTLARGPEQSPAVVGGVFGKWSEAVGEAIAAHVQPVRLDGRRLVVEVDQPGWATQLKFFDATIKERLHDIAQADIETIDVRVRARR